MTLFEPIDQRRLIIDRRSVSDAVAALPTGDDGKAERLAILRDALAKGRQEVERRLAAEPGAGRTAYKRRDSQFQVMSCPLPPGFI